MSSSKCYTLKNILEYVRKKPFTYIALIIFICLLITLLIINNNNNNKSNIQKILSHKNEVRESASEYSISYKNDTKREMYVFSSPVREAYQSSYSLFDKKIYKASSGIYETRNKYFNMEFTDEYIRSNYNQYEFSFLFTDKALKLKKEYYKNLYNEKSESVKYTGAFDNIIMYVIPAYNGFMLEFIIQDEVLDNKIKLQLGINKLKFKNDDAGYTQLLSTDGKVGLFYQGITIDKQNGITTQNKVIIDYIAEETFLDINLQNIEWETSAYPIKLSVSFDFYADKMFFDTPVYENNPNINYILSNINTIGTFKGKQSWALMRFDFKSITPKRIELLHKLSYNFYVIAVSEPVVLEMYMSSGNWCGWTVNWNDKPQVSRKIGEIVVSESGWHSFNLTDYIKNSINENFDIIQRNGIILKTKENNGFALLASADNTVNPPYIKINYKVS